MTAPSPAVPGESEERAVSGPTLLEAVRGAPHDHSHLRHPQTGNPFYDWWSAGRFQCDLCLAVMRDGGEDIALAFVLAFPFRMEHEFDRRWWLDSYLRTLRFVPERFDREYMREALASAVRRGREVSP